jgi:translation initiation factor IF-3
LEKGLSLAQERGYDLVEVAPKANPPVCKLLDWGAYLYKLEKEEKRRKSRQKEVEIKGLRLSFNIADHDLKTKLKQAQKFLEKGYKIRIEMVLKGRELAHVDRVKKIFRQFIDQLKEEGQMIKEEHPLKRQGRRFTQIISNLPK